MRDFAAAAPATADLLTRPFDDPAAATARKQRRLQAATLGLTPGLTIAGLCDDVRPADRSPFKMRRGVASRGLSRRVSEMRCACRGHARSEFADVGSCAGAQSRARRPSARGPGRSRLCSASGDHGCDPERSQQAAVLVVVIATVGGSRSGFWRGRPTLPVTGRLWRSSISGNSWVTSLRCPPVRLIANGMPLASTSRWCFEPCGHGQPGMARSGAPQKGADMAGVYRGARPVDLPGGISLTRSFWCSASHTPAFCQVRSRRQHVTPEP